MRVIHVINSLGYGGAETRVVGLLNALARAGHDVGLVCLLNDAPLLTRLSTGVRVYRLGIRGTADFFQSLPRLLNLLKRFSPLLVHTHLVHAGILGRIAGVAARVRVVSTQHNAYNPKGMTPVYRLECKTWALSSAMIALTDAIEEYLRAQGYRGQVHTVRSGVEIASGIQAAPPYTAGYLLSIGHFRDLQKGHDVLLSAYALLRMRFTQLPDLLIVGGGPLLGVHQELADSLGLGGSVKFLDPRDDIDSLLAHCGIFVLASRWEGLGRVLVEAMSAGCAVVSTTVEGIPEVVEDGVSGLLVPAESPVALADAVASLLVDEQLRGRLGRASRLRAERDFSHEAMVNGILRVYEKISDC